MASQGRVFTPKPTRFDHRRVDLEQRTEPRVDALERSTIARVSGRLVPFLVVCYFVAYLDRVNVGFAKLR